MKEKENNQPKKKSKLKIALIIITALVLLLFISGYFLLIGPGENIKSALIQDINGNVEINLGDNWVLATEEQQIGENDEIRTNQGTATLNINNGILVNLETNTLMTLESINKDKIQLKQDSGATWTKFMNVLGVGEYEIETPNSVAVVRGTEFKIELNGTKTTLLTTDGQVTFKDGEKEILVSKFEKAENTGDGVKSSELTNNDKTEILKQKEKLLSQIVNLRKEEIYKNEFILNQIKKQYGWDDAKIELLLEQIDKGEIDPTQYTDKVPFKIKNMDKILKYNDEIKDLILDIETLNNELNVENE